MFVLGSPRDFWGVLHPSFGLPSQDNRGVVLHCYGTAWWILYRKAPGVVQEILLVLCSIGTLYLAAATPGALLFFCLYNEYCLYTLPKKNPSARKMADFETPCWRYSITMDKARRTK